MLQKTIFCLTTLATGLLLSSITSLATAQTRTWSSADGKFQITAEMAGMEASGVRLRKEDGSEVVVPLEKLGEIDRQFARDWQASQQTDKPYDIPDRVKVLPVAFIADDESLPKSKDRELFLEHLRWTQKRYGEMLGGDTFELANEEITPIKGQHPLDHYRKQPENGAPDVVAEILDGLKLTRFDNPYVFCILVANSRDSFPVGGGRPINGGLNSGGGMMFISSLELHRNKHFQATLQHELGHSFGLPHPDVYGYDLKNNASLMSYNPAHFTDGLDPSPTPGILIPEDRRALAMNDRVFAATTFDPARDVPAGYELAPRIIPLGPMTLPGHPDFYPQVTTDGGEAARSSIDNVVRGQIKPSAGPGITYDRSNMWHSEKQPDQSATLTITFPEEVTLTGIAIHSQHSGIDHEVSSMQLEVSGPDGASMVAEQPITEVDATVTFPATHGRVWQLTLGTGKSGILVIRGLRFLNGEKDLVPHMVPYATDE